jgi:hypothetical protein
MEQRSAQPYQHQAEHSPAHYERQEYHNSRVMIGVTHALRTLGSLSPLIILEFVKEPNRASRWIKGASIVTTGVNEILWSCRVGRSREEERHR